MTLGTKCNNFDELPLKKSTIINKASGFKDDYLVHQCDHKWMGQDNVARVLEEFQSGFVF